ncbi:MAG: MotA/TolQ/ExbB proton channel family protein [Burkholderiales bacterium]|nr:MotA/TolQ/ExbB proton channel family protein [Burkholderiales bacterium]
MNVQLMHDMTFYAMYACAALAAFVIVERLIFYIVTMRHARELEAVMHHDIHDVSELPADLVSRESVPVEVLRQMLETKQKLTRRSDVEDLSEAIYIAMKAKLHNRLWILDTVVTAAPLLGLLGTILGIIDTFAVLATSGVSDPSGVSRAIGTALLATALGIAIALFGLVFFNHFQERVERINDHIKILLLRAGIGSQVEAA